MLFMKQMKNYVLILKRRFRGTITKNNYVSQYHYV